MAKRHPGLVVLSHDHHHGLALALRLRQGDSALLNDGWTHDRKEQARRVAEFYREELTVHFRAEEDALFPAMQQHVPAATGMIDELIKQHRELERLVGKLNTAGGSDLNETLTALGVLLERHIRIEERELFPMFEVSVPADVAVQIGGEVGLVHQEVRESLRAPLHVEVECIINAQTEKVFNTLVEKKSFLSLWPENVRCTLTSTGRMHRGDMLELLAANHHLRFVVEDIREPVYLSFRADEMEFSGLMKFTLMDFKGGRRIRALVRLTPAGGGEAAGLQALALECERALRSVLEMLHFRSEAP